MKKKRLSFYAPMAIADYRKYRERRPNNNATWHEWIIFLFQNLRCFNNLNLFLQTFLKTTLYLLSLIAILKHLQRHLEYLSKNCLQIKFCPSSCYSTGNRKFCLKSTRTPTATLQKIFCHSEIRPEPEVEEN